MVVSQGQPALDIKKNTAKSQATANNLSTVFFSKFK